MRRSVIEAPTWHEPAKREAIELELQLITPMFGGGYKTREVDLVMPIRPAAIRGHLRFWWRATAGAQYSDPKDLYAAETAIWGGAAMKDDDLVMEKVGIQVPVMGKVGIQVVVLESESLKLKPCAEYRKTGDGKYRATPNFVNQLPSYVLFPFRGELNKDRTEIIEQPASYLESLKFRLILTNTGLQSSQWEEVKYALWAWINLGGVGARTRRGCGSIQVRSAVLRTDTGQTKIQPCLFPNIPYSKQSVENTSAGILLTCLQGAEYIMGSPQDSALKAWHTAVEAYMYFRQGVGYARNTRRDPNGNHTQPGRSKWPEPDTIRRLVGRHAPSHEPKHPVDGFPRANLGLPIVFHFKDKNDPPDATLQRNDKGRTRFASPVITKAVATSDGKYAPLVLVLNSPSVCAGLTQDTQEVLTLVLDDGVKKSISLDMVELDPNRRKFPPLNGNSIREALLECVKKKMGNCKIGRL